MSTMAQLIVGNRVSRRHPIAGLMIASFLLGLLSSVSALSAAPHAIVGRTSIRSVSGNQPQRPFPPSALFPTRRSNNEYTHAHAFLTTRALSASSESSTIGGGKFPSSISINSSKKLAFATLSKFSHHVRKVRRSMFRAMAILSFCLFSMRSMTSPAHAAWGKSSAPDVVVVDTTAKSSPSSKLTKIVVTAAAVAAGAATAKKLRAFDDTEEGSEADADDNADDNVNAISAISTQEDNDVVSNEDKPPPLPLSPEWIEQELKEAEDQKKNPKPNGTTNPSSLGINKQDPILVKNLDSKIEMLRAREELAKVAAEQKRLEDMEKATEARMQEQSEIDAKIAAFEQQQKDKMREEKKKREKQLAEFENGKKEQDRLERQMKQKQEQEQQQKEQEKQLRAAEEAAQQQQKEQEQKLRAAEEAAQLQQKEQEQQLRAAEEAAQQKQKGQEQKLRDAEEAAQSVSKNTESTKNANGGTGEVHVEQAREQPKSVDDEKKLKEKYGSMDLEERAFNILVDLGMVDLHSDPASLDLNDEEEDDGNVFM